ncbi:hypothetical protein M407DRAFT_27937 [Tulasnella calospora MUT 4182]|uniref:Aldehyde dehydrogenase domain-containing protein n=1 Tax=Tulasnella calospora MUT 4182 TaxID=1051891 RepID=A0A0C3LMG7_9AGAM|nr:hypothetical protein M407DRAFT_27937 [Tulasnella calospora MUT 4182]
MRSELLRKAFIAAGLPEDLLQVVHLSLELAEALIKNPLINFSPGEVRGTVERAKYMISIAKSSLADMELKDTDKPGLRRFIKLVPLGVVLVIAPWTYLYLPSINSVLPAILAGNSVILKPSPQTPLTGELLRKAFIAAGLPEDLLQVVYLSPELAEALIKNSLIKFVSFTGSVARGHLVAKEATLSSAFKGVALALGGKDAAYVREDAGLDYTTAKLVNGAFFNSGQSCCAMDRIYVHQSKYDDFVKKLVEIAKTYKCGDPTKEDVNLGPVVTVGSADLIRKQVQDVPDDKEALYLTKYSKYGLTASIWTNAAGATKSEEAFLELCQA